MIFFSFDSARRIEKPCYLDFQCMLFIVWIILMNFLLSLYHHISISYMIKIVIYIEIRLEGPTFGLFLSLS